jgi:RimJ/RimL family protein N-acetyltransferase
VKLGWDHEQPLGHGDGVAEVGFLLASAFHGKGYGLESLRALCRFGFAKAGYRKLTATVTAGNAPSKAVLEKVGFVQEGTLRESYFLAGRWQDDWLFGLLQREFD